MRALDYMKSITVLCCLCLPSLAGAEAMAEPDAQPLPTLAENTEIKVAPASVSGQSLEVKGVLSNKGIMNEIREDSALNPENSLLGLKENVLASELELSVSDYFNQSKDLRWLLKIYSYYSTSPYTDQLVLLDKSTRFDEVFVDWKNSGWFVSLGKRRLNWGQALAFSPVNVMVPARSPLDPEVEQEGRPMVWASKTLGIFTLDAIYTRDYDSDWISRLSRWGGRLRMVSDWVDGALYYFDGQPYQDGRAFERMLGISGARDVVPGITLYAETAMLVHAYGRYYTEAANGTEKDQQVFPTVLGSYILLPPESIFSFLNGDANLTLEILLAQQGFTANEREAYYRVLGQLPLENRPMFLADSRTVKMKNQLYYLAAYRNSFWERYQVEITGLLAKDLSWIGSAKVQYDLADYYRLVAKTVFYQGKSETEFGNVPVSSTTEVVWEIHF